MKNFFLKTAVLVFSLGNGLLLAEEKSDESFIHPFILQGKDGKEYTLFSKEPIAEEEKENLLKKIEKPEEENLDDNQPSRPNSLDICPASTKSKRYYM